MAQNVDGKIISNVIVRAIASFKFDRLYLFIALLILASIDVYAQNQPSQLWLDFTQNARSKNGYSFNNQVSYRTILDNTDKWRSLSVLPQIEKEFGKNFDIIANLNLIYTQQHENYNTWEIRPGLGIRYHFEPLKKLTLRLLGRVEFRDQYTTEIDSWKQSFRSRFRFEQNFLINGKSFSENNLWYAIADQEIFLKMDKEVEERYSNELLFRLGLGWKQNKNWRYEFIYGYQFSKNTIEGEFAHQTGGIFRLRGRYYFR